MQWVCHPGLYDVRPSTKLTDSMSLRGDDHQWLTKWGGKLGFQLHEHSSMWSDHQGSYWLHSEWKWKQTGGRNLRLPGNEWAGQCTYDKPSMMCHRESLLPNYIRYPIKSLLNKVYCNSSVTMGTIIRTYIMWSDHQSLTPLRVVVEMNSWENEVRKLRLPGNEWMGHLIWVLDQYLVAPRGCPTEKWLPKL